MSETQQKIKQMLSLEYLQQLASFKPPFNPLEALGLERHEPSHSNFLAWLLRDDVNSEFRLKFFAGLVDSFGPYRERDLQEIVVNHDFLATYGEIDRNLDLLVIAPKLNIVVAIEVEIDGYTGAAKILDC